MSHSSEECQQYAARAIGELARESPRKVIDAGALPRTVELLNHSSKDVRKNATRVICRIARERPEEVPEVGVSQALLSLIDQGTETVRERAAESVAWITAERPDTVLSNVLSGEGRTATDESPLSPFVDILKNGDTQARRAITEMLAVLSETRPSVLVPLQHEIRAYIRENYDGDPDDDGEIVEMLLEAESRAARESSSLSPFDEEYYFEATISQPNREIVLGDETPGDSETDGNQESGEEEAEGISPGVIDDTINLTAEKWKDERPHEYKRLYEQVWDDNGRFKHCGLQVDRFQSDDKYPPVLPLTIDPAMSTDLIDLLSQFAIDFGRMLQDRLAE